MQTATPQSDVSPSHIWWNQLLSDLGTRNLQEPGQLTRAAPRLCPSGQTPSGGDRGRSETPLALVLGGTATWLDLGTRMSRIKWKPISSRARGEQSRPSLTFLRGAGARGPHAHHSGLAARLDFLGASRRVSDGFLSCAWPGGIRAPSSPLGDCSIADAACPPGAARLRLDPVLRPARTPSRSPSRLETNVPTASC